MHSIHGRRDIPSLFPEKELLPPPINNYQNASNTSLAMHGIEKLKGKENYDEWRVAMQAVMELEDVWGCVTNNLMYVNNRRGQIRARALLILSVDPSFYSQIKNCQTSKEMWDTLESLFKDNEENSVTKKVELMQSLMQTKLDDCPSMDEYINRVITTITSLRNLKFKISDEMVATILLAGLPEDYQSLISELETSRVKIATHAIKTRLLHFKNNTNNQDNNLKSEYSDNDGEEESENFKKRKHC